MRQIARICPCSQLTWNEFAAEMCRQISTPTETMKGMEKEVQDLLKEIEGVEQKKRVHSQVIR